MEYEDDENKEIPFTKRYLKMIVRNERAVQGYTDQDGVWVAGLLQNTADGIQVMKRVKLMAYIICSVALFNALHVYGAWDMVARLIK